jgi:hypothetical protein
MGNIVSHMTLPLGRGDLKRIAGTGWILARQLGGELALGTQSLKRHGVLRERHRLPPDRQRALAGETTPGEWPIKNR